MVATTSSTVAQATSNHTTGLHSPVLQQDSYTNFFHSAYLGAERQLFLALDAQGFSTAGQYLHIVENNPDGACGFHGVSACLSGGGDGKQLRTDAVAYLKYRVRRAEHSGTTATVRNHTGQRLTLNDTSFTASDWLNDMSTQMLSDLTGFTIFLASKDGTVVCVPDQEEADLLLQETRNRTVTKYKDPAIRTAIGPARRICCLMQVVTAGGAEHWVSASLFPMDGLPTHTLDLPVSIDVYSDNVTDRMLNVLLPAEVGYT